MEEATAGGKALKEAGYKFDVAHTSLLTRAQVRTNTVASNKIDVCMVLTTQVTLATVLKEIGQEDLAVEKTWRLNERHYGGLTGLNKAETAAKHGEEQVGETSIMT